jgi:hypothetical protein
VLRIVVTLYDVLVTCRKPLVMLSSNQLNKCAALLLSTATMVNSATGTLSLETISPLDLSSAGNYIILAKDRHHQRA